MTRALPARFVRAFALALGGAACLPSAARAHPAPAEAPDFGMPACIAVIDKTHQTGLDITYSLMSDDTTFGPLDIPMPGAKTHQFFAFAGALFPDSMALQWLATDPQDGDPVEVPLWINEDDVMRAALASGDVAGAMFSASDIPGDAILVQDAALAGSFVRITADAARLPITLEQAMTAVHWDLSQVAPGAYTIAAYIFSPPYNGWAIRPGLVKLTDAQHDAPAAVIDPVNDFVFSYQGRKVNACIDAPSGTRLEVAVRFEEHAELGYIAALPSRDVGSGPLALCLPNPKPELSGSLRVRFVLTAPDGTRSAAYSPDRFTALSGQGSCVESDTVCCDFAPASAGEKQATSSSDHGGATKAMAGGCSVLRLRARWRADVFALILLAAIVLIARVRRGRVARGIAALVLLCACSEATPRAAPTRPVPAKSGAARAEPLHPTNPHALTLPREMAALGAARYYREQGKPAEALALLDRLAQGVPSPALPAEALAERAATLCALGRMADAKRAIDDLSQRSAAPELLAHALAGCAPP